MKLKLVAGTLFCLAALLVFFETSSAQNKSRIHPMNKKLVLMGEMPIPKYYPEIPRITAEQAYSLYLNDKALFVLISYTDKHQIVGGLHFTEDIPSKINPNKLPFKKGQVLVLY